MKKKKKNVCITTCLKKKLSNQKLKSEMSIIMLFINNARYLLVYFFTLIRITINELQISWWTYDINFPHTFYFNCKKKGKKSILWQVF